MNVWLLKVGEPIPSDAGSPRLFRMGLLAETLVSKGHDVTWWTSSFNHALKQQRSETDMSVQVGDHLEVRLLRSPGYRSNVSLARLWDHLVLAAKFARQAPRMPHPDIVVSSLPTIELSLAAVRFGRRREIPVVVDIRDLWPDEFALIVPRLLRPLARALLFPVYSAVRASCRGASAIIGITQGFLEWGLRHGSRLRTPQDGVFPLGYSTKEPSAIDLEKALNFWGAVGLSLDGKEFLAVFAGNLGRQFDIDTVIQAARILQKRGRPIKFVLCGSGDNLNTYSRRAADCSNVLFPGWVGRAEIWTLLGLASVGLAPYRSSETFARNLPNKAFEYMSAALPVVSSLKGALEELLSRHDCGVTYQNGDAEALADVLCSLQDDPQRLSAMGTNGRAVFQQHYVTEELYARFVEHLESIVKSRNEGAVRSRSV